MTVEAMPPGGAVKLREPRALGPAGEPAYHNREIRQGVSRRPGRDIPAQLQTLGVGHRLAISRHQSTNTAVRWRSPVLTRG